jgi:hypothetical protein
MSEAEEAPATRAFQTPSSAATSRRGRSLGGAHGDPDGTLYQGARSTAFPTQDKQHQSLQQSPVAYKAMLRLSTTCRAPVSVEQSLMTAEQRRQVRCASSQLAESFNPRASIHHHPPSPAEHRKDADGSAGLRHCGGTCWVLLDVLGSVVEVAEGAGRRQKSPRSGRVCVATERGAGRLSLMTDDAGHQWLQ